MAEFDFVIDCETMGTHADAPICSIAVAAVRDGEEIVDQMKVVMAPSQWLGTIDPETVAWWLQQTDDARAALLTGGSTLDEALDDLEDFIFQHCRLDEAKVWGFGAVADIVWLESAFRRLNRDIPWTYKNVRCLRTLCEETGTDWKVFIPEGQAHHDPLVDALAEAKGLIAALASIAA
ncbi:3'-5' exonuclease [Sulfitobacter sp. 1A15106]|uniref:3'-5' exonuclease n=1 Tax=Sulfitobacter sp. 1A15106 TaxID=3368590 RepID=UPI00374527CD